MKKMIRVYSFILAVIILLSASVFPVFSAETTVLMDESFDDYEAGVEASATKLASLFVTDANSIGDGYIRVEEDDTGNLYLLSHVFTQTYLRSPLKGAYVFSVSSSEMQGAHQSGLFLRAPLHSAAYYEGDGGDPERGTSCGMSGIWVYGYNNKIEVNVKSVDNTKPNKIANNTVSFPMPEGSYCGGSTSCTFRFEDDGESIAMYADGTLFCTVAFSVGETSKKARTASISVPCFKTVTVYDAEHNEMMTVTDPLVSANESVVGWATRVANMKVDNVYIEAVSEEAATTAAQTEPVTEPATEPMDVPSAEELDAAFPVVHTNHLYPWLKASTETYAYDFSDTDITVYSQDKKLATASLRTNMVFDGSTLSCKEGKTFSFGSAVFAGDDYGYVGGTVQLKLALTGGFLSVGTRLEKTASDNTRKGLWFTFTPSGVTVTVPQSNFAVKVADTFPADEGTLTFADDVDNVTLSRNGTVICSVQYLNAHGDIVVRGADGKPLGYVQDTELNPAGYFTLWADSMGGCIDDLSFTHTTVTDTTVYSGDHTPDYSTWVATDDRNRTTPTADTSTVRADKQVGMFYFICHTGDNTSELPLDITSLYLKWGKNRFTEYLSDGNTSGCFHWAEPYFGYYKNTDEFVFRRHAYMLEAAGVDFIFIDNTNGAFYSEAVVTLFDTWLKIREEGNSTPDICIFGGSSSNAVLNGLQGSIYSKEGFEKYGDLFYEYQGKPLYLGKLSSMSDSIRAFAEEKFTVRDCWAWTDENGSWNWLQEYNKASNGTYTFVNGGKGRDLNGTFEELALCIAHHPTTSKGRSYVFTTFPDVNGDYGFSLDSGAGTGYAAQYEAVKFFDPTFMLITGWNEWIAGLNHNGDRTYAGTENKGNFYMVDTFNTEYSRDAEPMKLRQGDTVGFGDNYYYQTVSIIRDFKGQNAVTKASGQQTVDIRTASDWANVGPDYRDNVGDAAVRHSDGYSVNTVYVNNTGRNDFDTAKVSQDKDYLYFTVSCIHDIVKDNSSNWMNLFINLDGKSETGWEGFDFVLNRDRDGYYVSIESLADGWDGKAVGQSLYTVTGNTMTVRVSKAALGVSGEISDFLFKWADNSTWTGNVMEFMDLGDTAPNDRFAYRYIGTAGESRDITYTLDGEALRDECTPLSADKAVETETESETDSATVPATEPDGTETDAVQTGCSSSAACVLTVLIMTVCAAVVYRKKSHS